MEVSLLLLLFCLFFFATRRPTASGQTAPHTDLGHNRGLSARAVIDRLRKWNGQHNNVIAFGGVFSGPSVNALRPMITFRFCVLLASVG